MTLLVINNLQRTSPYRTWTSIRGSTLLDKNIWVPFTFCNRRRIAWIRFFIKKNYDYLRCLNKMCLHNILITLSIDSDWVSVLGVVGIIELSYRKINQKDLLLFSHCKKNSQFFIRDVAIVGNYQLHSCRELTHEDIDKFLYCFFLLLHSPDKSKPK